MAVTKYDKIILQVTRDTITGLWRVPLQSLDIPTHQSNKIHKVNGKDNAIKYLHAAAFRPVQDTWDKAVNWGATLTHRLDSQKKTSTRWLRLRPKSRATPHISGIIQGKQKPRIILETSIRTQIQATNKITAKQSSLWIQWMKLTRYTQTRGENSWWIPVKATSIY